MDSTWSVLAALAFGVLIGAGFTVVLHIAERRGQSAARVVAPTIPDGVDQVLDVLESAGVVLDPSNNVLRASPGALAMGLVRNQMLVHPELLDLVATVRRTGEPVATELLLARGPFSDATMQVDVRVARLGTRFVLLLADDRTESVRLEAVRRDFVANISHELKTPVGGLAVLADAMAGLDDLDLIHSLAERMVVEAHRASSTIDDLLELSRIELGGAIDHEMVDVGMLIAEAVARVRTMADAAGVRVAVTPCGGASVRGDERQLVSAIANLVDNAVKYSDAGGCVEVSFSSTDEWAEVAVCDRGIGIPAKDIDRVFERFYRVDRARSRHTGGTGLGLAIVRHVANNHGGHVSVESREGEGSTFTLRVPLGEE